MAIVPLYGHDDLRSRLRDAAIRNALPSTILLHGNRGVGKQRLALWLAQVLLCDAGLEAAPCGKCQHCRFGEELRHPDLHWYFPRPRPKDSDPDLDDVREDLAEAIEERARNRGLYEPPPGNEGIFIATVRAIVQQSVLSPAIARRKVFIVGDAERMVPQEGSEQAANAFLKLLEEPPADATIILTSSEPGALLPTVRSRAALVRVPPVTGEAIREFLSNPEVAKRIARDANLPADLSDRIDYSGGAPGRLLAGESWQTAMDNAGRMLDSVIGKPAAHYEAAWSQATTKARGSFADTLDALTVKLHERARTSMNREARHEALAATRAIEAVEVAKERVTSNVSPQLITVNLVRELKELLS
jgi:DNA polymerase III subunit delta'